MKAYLRQLTDARPNPSNGSLLVREYLQARILQLLQDHGAFQRWAFLGGTALRLLYGLPRFSEDLDFSLISAGAEPGFREALLDVRRALVPRPRTRDHRRHRGGRHFLPLRQPALAPAV